ncbi:MAG TPA: hypothetical protein VG796_26570 [Verrucomicrobiales bacterium]|jgi:hypothetical protein|nr:hypothetical protein [Verrucomicrobiales bacterium]
MKSKPGMIAGASLAIVAACVVVKHYAGGDINTASETARLKYTTPATSENADVDSRKKRTSPLPELELEPAVKVDPAQRTQAQVVEDANARLMGALLSGKHERPTAKHREIAERTAIIQKVLRAVKPRRGSDPAITMTPEERADFEDTVNKLKTIPGAEWTAQDLETLELMSSPQRNTVADFESKRHELQERLDARLKQERKALEEEMVTPESREEFVKARQEYEAEFQKLKASRDALEGRENER